MKSYKVVVAVTVLNVALVAAAWFGIVGAQPSGAQERSGIVEASGFKLVNDDGIAAVQLYVADDGAGQIRLTNGSGEVRVKLGAGADGSGLILMDGTGEPVPGVWAITGKEGTKLTLAGGERKKVIKP